MNISKSYRRILGVLASLLIIGLALLWVVIFNESPLPAPVPSPGNNAENHDAAVPPAEQIEVRLYFPASGPISSGFGILQEERRWIRKTTSTADFARALLEALSSGSREGRLSVIPPTANLHQVYLIKDGRAILNYGHALTENCPEGMEGELALVYSIVNTLTRNIPEIRAVRILIDGTERETLGGHLDISGFLDPDMSLVRAAGPAVDPAHVQPPPP